MARHWNDIAMTTDTLLTTEAILDAFATAGRVLPRTALEQAVDRWSEIGPALLANHCGPRWALGIGEASGFAAAIVAVYALARLRPRPSV